MKTRTNLLYNKEIGNKLETLYGMLDDAYEELRERKVAVKRSGSEDMFYWSGIRIEEAKSQFFFSISCWYSYYENTGIPLCFTIEDYDDNIHNQLKQRLKQLIANEPSLCEYREIDGHPVCGVKAEKFNELCKNGTLADYFLNLVSQLGYRLKLK